MNSPENSTPEPSPTDQPTGCVGKVIALTGVFISGIWLLNFTFGIAEDSLPIIGNLDEAIATTILIYCLSRLGVNTSWLSRGKAMRITKKDE